MSQPAVSALAPLPFELVYSDGEPLESEWHTLQPDLLKEVIHQAMAERGRRDFFVGGNMFVYYSVEQAQDVAQGKSYFRGPDVFWVGGVKSPGLRKAWVSWEEGGRLPDVIVDLLSPSTADIDRTVKRNLYARMFRTPEYYLYDPETLELAGLKLTRRAAYHPMTPNAQGQFWSEQLGAFLGHWHGVVRNQESDWIRLYRADGSLVPTAAEAERQQAETERQRAEAERQRAEMERQRAEEAEAELARLRALLQERGQD